MKIFTKRALAPGVLTALMASGIAMAQTTPPVSGAESGGSYQTLKQHTAPSSSEKGNSAMRHHAMAPASAATTRKHAKKWKSSRRHPAHASSGAAMQNGSLTHDTEMKGNMQSAPAHQGKSGAVEGGALQQNGSPPLHDEDNKGH